jgi:hypothetical protein
MHTSSPFRGAGRPVGSRLSPALLTAIVGVFVSSSAGAARAQDSDSGATTAERNWEYPSRGPSRSEARAADPNRSGWDPYPWHWSVAAGPAWFNGDNLSDTPAFAVEARLAKDLTDEVYLVGSYDFALVESELGSNSFLSSEWHDVHALAFGVGFGFDLTPEVQFFVEPRAGVLFGSDADVAPVVLLSAGLEASVTEVIAVRFAITGLVTDTDINRDNADAHIDSGIMGTFGIAFEF